MDSNLPGFSIRGIFQARVLEWVANILNNTSCQEHANRNHNEVSFHIKKDSFNKRMSTSIGENVEKLKHPYFVGGDAYGVAPFEDLGLEATSRHFWRRQWHPTPVVLPGKSHGWQSLVGCNPWGR